MTVVAKLAVQLLPTPEICSSNPSIGKLNLLNTVFKYKIKVKETKNDHCSILNYLICFITIYNEAHNSLFAFLFYVSLSESLRHMPCTCFNEKDSVKICWHCHRGVRVPKWVSDPTTVRYSTTSDSASGVRFNQSHRQCDQISDLLEFGPLFKACGNN